MEDKLEPRVCDLEHEPHEGPSVEAEAECEEIPHLLMHAGPVIQQKIGAEQPLVRMVRLKGRGQAAKHTSFSPYTVTEPGELGKQYRQIPGSQAQPGCSISGTKVQIVSHSFWRRWKSLLPSAPSFSKVGLKGLKTTEPGRTLTNELDSNWSSTDMRPC